MTVPTSQRKDVRVVGAELHFLPVHTRVPLKFGPETTTRATCARARVAVRNRDGREGFGWGETPLSVAWVWPSALTYAERDAALCEFTRLVGGAVADFSPFGHPMELGREFMEDILPGLLADFNRRRAGREPMPWLAALVCYSAFDIAIHDAYASLLGESVYAIYDAGHMNRDLSWYYGPEYGKRFAGKYPADFLLPNPPKQLRAWHLVGGKDALTPDDLVGDEPDDGHPVLLADWITRDGLTCLKVKLTGTDMAWDWERLVRVGDIAVRHGVDWLSADFNCTVRDVAYVNAILDRLTLEHPRLAGMILYVEQPFPYDIRACPLDVHSVSARKPLFMDESAHDWRHVAFGRELGWTGVALKTCKSQTGALLALCWAKAHGMTLMVQDLTNPMLAQIPHLLLAAHAGTIMGVETNAMQFYPDASAAEAAVHPGAYRRRSGMVDIATLGDVGFGYCLDKMRRMLPPKESPFSRAQ